MEGRTGNKARYEKSGSRVSSRQQTVSLFFIGVRRTSSREGGVENGKESQRQNGALLLYIPFSLLLLKRFFSLFSFLVMSCNKSVVIDFFFKLTVFFLILKIFYNFNSVLSIYLSVLPQKVQGVNVFRSLVEVDIYSLTDNCFFF